VQEAGGVVTDFSGAPYLLGGARLLASNGRIHGEMQEAVNRVAAQAAKL
jgi:fructose-1,6-bisphosphatase/inositol monophosphatase family enzyme